jgi:hypothetical protein
MCRLLASERPYDARNLSDIRPGLLVVRRPDEILAVVGELVLRLGIFVGNPEVVVLRIDIGEIEHLLEVPSDGADETQLNALSWHESHFPEGKGTGRAAGSGQQAAGSGREALSAERSSEDLRGTSSYAMRHALRAMRLTPNAMRHALCPMRRGQQAADGEAEEQLAAGSWQRAANAKRQALGAARRAR